MTRTLSGLLLAGTFLSTPAWADGTAVNPPAAIKYACQSVLVADDGTLSTGNRPLSQAQLVEGMLLAAGYNTRLLMTAKDWSGTYDERLLKALHTRPPNMDAETWRVFGQYILYIGQDALHTNVFKPEDLGLAVTSTAPAEWSRYWMFDTAGVTMACLPTKPAKSFSARTKSQSTTRFFGLVAKVEDLPKTGNDRKSADSAIVGVKVQTVPVDDGTHKRTTTTQFDGTLGIHLPLEKGPTSYAFATYNLSSARSKPQKPLGAGEKRKDGDTNALKLGVAFFDAGEGTMTLSGQGAYVQDYVSGSRRAMAQLMIQPGFEAQELTFCGLGKLKTVTPFGLRFRTQCTADLRIAYSHVYRAGTAKFDDHSDFTSAGFLVGIRTAPPVYEKSGLISSLTYIYEPTISGHADDISRLEGTLKYRVWLDSGVAIDFGGSVKHGENPISYTYEDVFNLSFGILY